MSVWLRITVALLLIVLVSVGGYLIATVHHSSSRIGIVRMTEILEKYQGAADARTGFSKTAMAWQSNIDTLRSELQEMIMSYEKDRHAMSVAQRTSFENVLQMKRRQVEDYASAIQQRATDEQRAVTEKLIAKVKHAADASASEMGMDLVIAVQDDAFVLYSTEAVDVTSHVLGRLRQQYIQDAGSTK